MLTARLVDEAERQLVRRGEAFFHVSGAGHEASAALAPHLIPEDWLHCHYRDKALLLLRGVPPTIFFSSLLCKAASHSAGRQMSAHLSDPARHVLSITGPVGNSALQAVGVAAAVRDRPARPVVLCAVGDGTTQQGEFLEACAEAVRWQLPVLFLVEDNRWAISTPTAGRTFYSLPDGPAEAFYGLPIRRVDGRDAVAAYHAFREVVARMRDDRRPALVVLDVERLADHTNADDQSLYRDAAEIRAARAGADPVRILEGRLRDMGVSERALLALRAEVEAAVADAEAEAAGGPDPAAVFGAKAPLPPDLTDPAREYRGRAGAPRLTMREALGQVLRERLAHDDRVVLYGQDIEDPKGDVFGVTRGLSTAFPGRVRNAPLSESTIVGASVGRALAGDRPVAFLQFADFLPLAYNQIVSELGSLYWRTAGGWQAPVIVMASCGGYRPGLGPFHAQSPESVAAHTPGVDVLMPSTAADAAGLLNAAFASGRPTLFFYPKACLNLAAQATSADVSRHFVPIGVARTARAGRDITLVAWGNTVGLCAKAAEALAAAGVEAEVLDLRSLSPWDERAVLASAEKTGRLVVVHEDNHTCGLGAEVLATVAEKARAPVAVRRVTRPDTYVPCNFANQLEVLPSLRSVLAAAAALLDLQLTWRDPPPPEEGVFVVEAVGSGPSDESVRIDQLPVRPGARVAPGAVLAVVEASKALFEISSPVAGTVRAVLAREGETVGVGKPLVEIRTAAAGRRKPVTQERPGTPVLARRTPAAAAGRDRAGGDRRPRAVGLAAVAAVTGSRVVANDELLTRHPGRTAADVLRLTGIESRRWVAGGEDALRLAARAARAALGQARLSVADLDTIVCSTITPPALSPSLACRVLAELAGGMGGAAVQAYDINAACSGYLYALQAAYDYLQGNPRGRVLVLTAEAPSPLLDPDDFDTAILFGDAASATVVVGEAHLPAARARLHRPELSARGEDGSTLAVPFPGHGHIRMRGASVFAEAVRAMVSSLNRACGHAGIPADGLALVVPHQANQRILDAVGRRVSAPVYSNIRHLGNTSSTSIPLALRDALPGGRPGDRLGLCAFGGGFTFGAAIVEVLPEAAPPQTGPLAVPASVTTRET
jgi:2-oxoisovalerate dehydrogenase E1 component